MKKTAAKKAVVAHNLTFAVWQEGTYHVAQCLNVDVSSFGKTYDEAVNNLREAVSLYLEDGSLPLLPISKPSIFIDTAQHV